MKLLKIKTPLLLIVFLILSACASKPTTKFDGKWAFCEVVPYEEWACLRKEDVQKLRQLLIECQSKNKK